MVNKPWGILSQKSKPEDISINDQIIPYAVNQGLISEKELQVVKPSICNRLDRNTTGIIICGISIEGLQTMAEMLKHRDMEKYYLCIVKGKLERTQKVSAYLKKDEKTNKVTKTPGGARRVRFATRRQRSYRQCGAYAIAGHAAILHQRQRSAGARRYRGTGEHDVPVSCACFSWNRAGAIQQGRKTGKSGNLWSNSQVGSFRC